MNTSMSAEKPTAALSMHERLENGSLKSTMLLFQGKMKVVLVDSDLLCNFCKFPCNDAMACTCGKDLRCRSCIQKRVMYANAKCETLCNECVGMTQECQEKKTLAEKLYESTRQYSTKKFINDHYEIRPSVYKGAPEKNNTVWSDFYQPLTEGSLTAFDITCAQACQSKMAIRDLLSSASPEKMLPKQESTHDAVKTIPLCGNALLQKIHESGVVMLCDMYENTNWKTTQAIEGGYKAEFSQKKSDMKICFNEQSLSSGKTTQVSVLVDSCMINWSLMNERPFYVESCTYLIHSSVATNPVDVVTPVPYDSNPNSICCGWAAGYLGDPYIKALVVNLGSVPFSTQKLPIKFSGYNAVVNLSLPDSPILLAIIDERPLSQATQQNNERIEGFEQKLGELPELPLVQRVYKGRTSQYGL